jgi:DNA-binding Lrp family transcriptional regulator
MIPFDRIDDAILSALQNNARMSNKELAVEVGLAPSSCLERVRRLQRRGVLRGYRAQVDPAALGIGLEAFVSVTLTQHSRTVVEAFREHVRGLRETVGVYHVAGQADFLVHVAVRDADHLRDLALDAFTTREEVSRLNTSLIYEHLRQPVLPNYAVDAPGS